MGTSGKMRSYGRSNRELRPFKVAWDPMGFALSSLIISTGKTSVICSASLQEGVPRWREGKGLGWLSAEYRLLPGSTPNRQNRELLKLSGRTQEIQRLIGRSLRSVMNMTALGENTLLIDCDVIQADAGTRTASVTGAWMAVQKACLNLIDKGQLVSNPMEGQVAALSVGFVEGIPLVDLDYSEDSIADVDLNVVMDSEGRFLELQGTAEGAPFTREELNILLDLAEPGIRDLHVSQLSAFQQKN